MNNRTESIGFRIDKNLAKQIESVAPYLRGGKAYFTKTDAYRELIIKGLEKVMEELQDPAAKETLELELNVIRRLKAVGQDILFNERRK